MDIKERCLEATETILNTPGRVGPSVKSGFWPSIEGETWDYAPDETKVRRLPTAGEIARCDQFTGWVNQLESEYERREIWTWGFLQVRRDRTIRGYCEKLGLKEHGYRRQIGMIFQKLTKISGIKPEMRPNTGVDANSFQGEKTSSSEKSRTNWMATDARPEHLPDSEGHKALIKRLLKKQQNRVGA